MRLVALNLLEHLPDDGAALAEFARVLRPGGRAVIVVPANPRLYDYYDAHLRHERRYAPRRGGRSGRAQPGSRRWASTAVGSVVYPAFWAVKMRNRRRRLGPGEAREAGGARHRPLVSPPRWRAPPSGWRPRCCAGACGRAVASARARGPGARRVTAYLVTGGAGFIGSHVTRRLAEDPTARVTVFDNFTSGREEHLDDGSMTAACSW